MILKKFYKVKGRYIATDWKRIKCPACGTDTKHDAQVSTNHHIDEYIAARNMSDAKTKACFRFDPGGWARVMVKEVSLAKRLQLNGMAQLLGMPE